MASNGQLIPIPVDDPLQMAWLDTNDLGNAERLVRLAKGLLLWVDAIGWVAYDGKRWSSRDGERRASQLAHEVARHIDREASALSAIADDRDRLEEAFGWAVPIELAQERVVNLRKHAVKSGDASRTAAMLAQARTLIPALREDFDRDPLAFNVLNGTLRFIHNGDGRWESRRDPHEPRDLIMQLAQFEHDGDADCPQWMERLALVQPDRDQRQLLQMLFGYCLTALTDEQKWFIFQGRGGDGKSLTLSVIGDLMGDYYRHAGVETFLQGAQRSGADHSSDLARLQGDIRLVSFDEPPTRSTWNGSRLKQITGGKITARPLRQEEIEYVPRWKVIGEVNPLPAVPSDDDGFWRRCRVCPWPYQFDKGGQAAEPWSIVRERLLVEASGILNWMIAGAVKWLGERRLPMPQASAAALDSYRASASTFGEWLDDRCDTSDRGAVTPASALYEDFKTYCEALGVDKVTSQTAFGNRLRDRQILVRKDTRGNRVRVGIRLKPSTTPLEQSGSVGRESSPPATIGPDDEADWRDDQP